MRRPFASTLLTALLIMSPAIIDAQEPAPAERAPIEIVTPTTPAPSCDAGQGPCPAPPIEVQALGRLDPQVAASMNRIDGGSRARMVRVGSARYVEAMINDHPVYLELDPGAPLLSLSPRFLASAGMRTERVGAADLGLLKSLTLGQLTLGALTYTVCAGCQTAIAGLERPVVGKLGQSVLARLRVAVDDGAGELDVAPGELFRERSRDVAPWVVLDTQIEPYVGRFGQDIRLHTIATSVAPRAALITVRYDCELPTGRMVGIISSAREVRASGRGRLETQAPFAACMRISAYVAGASW